MIVEVSKMINCPYTNTCTKFRCDFSCKEFSEFEHWMNRCDLSLSNPVTSASSELIEEAEVYINRSLKDFTFDSSYSNLGVVQVPKPAYFADLISYVLILKYCKNIGFYNGAYKLNYASYLDEIKKGWSSRNSSESLEDINIWIQSSKFLVIYNLGLVRFGDFESQTLLSILQNRYGDDKYTIIVLEKGAYCLPGKNDSIFYSKLKKEITSRGAKV